MQCGRYFLFTVFVLEIGQVLGIGQAQAAELAANLKTQIELLPSCKINDQHYSANQSGIHFGEINFGEIAANYTGSIQATLKNDYTNRIKIECSDQTPVTVTFGAGQYDQHIPAKMKNNYFHAMSNGQDFIAYNLLHGSDKQVVKPQQDINLPNNQKVIYVQLYGQAEFLPNQRISQGSYADLVQVTIKF